MTRTSSRRALAALTLALLVPCAAAVAGAPAHASQVTALSDLNLSMPLPAFTTMVGQEASYLQSKYCQLTAPKARTLTLTTAVKNANSYLAAHSTAAARHAFANSAGAKHENTALAAGASAAAASSPTAALAALLRAHTLAPHDPMPLVDSAPVLTNLKLPNEALAFLTAAARMTPPVHTPWGISAKALIANNKGYALLALKRWSDAQTALQAATKAAPALSEAELNLAEADLCQGRTAAAARMMFFGVRRDPQVVKDLVDGGTGDPTPTQAGVDVDHGAKITLPTYTYPKSMLAGALTATGFRNDMIASSSKELDLVMQVNSLSSQLNSELANANPATRRRTQQLVGVAITAKVDPTITPLSDARLKIAGELDGLSTTRLGQMAVCTSPNATHDQWLGLINKYDAATRAEISAEYQLETSAGASLENATAHEEVMVDASEWAQVLMSSLLQQADFLTMWDEQCTPNPPQSNADPVDDATDDRGTSPRCPSGLAGKGWQLNVGPVQVSVDCENVALEVDTGGWIGAFGNVSHNFTDGSTTIFAGPRAKVNPGPWGPNLNFKDGLYMTFDSSGAVKDMGARVETGSELNLGPAGGATFSGDSMNFSIVGASPVANTAAP
jgi:tetratricopeptide (TPR) repeat protein